MAPIEVEFVNATTFTPGRAVLTVEAGDEQLVVRAEGPTDGSEAAVIAGCHPSLTPDEALTYARLIEAAARLAVGLPGLVE